MVLRKSPKNSILDTFNALLMRKVLDLFGIPFRRELTDLKVDDAGEIKELLTLYQLGR